MWGWGRDSESDVTGKDSRRGRGGESTVRGRQGGKDPDEYVARWRGWGVKSCAGNSQSRRRSQIG